MLTPKCNVEARSDSPNARREMRSLPTSRCNIGLLDGEDAGHEIAEGFFHSFEHKNGGRKQS